MKITEPFKITIRRTGVARYCGRAKIGLYKFRVTGASKASECLINTIDLIGLKPGQFDLSEPCYTKTRKSVNYTVTPKT